MSEQYRPDPALPQNPQPSGGQGYPQQPAPPSQPMYGNAPAPAAELPEKPAYRGTVVAVLIVGIIAALLRIIDIIMGLYLHPQAKISPKNITSAKVNLELLILVPEELSLAS